MSELQNETKQKAFEESDLPTWYTSNGEPRSQAGITAGLSVVVDAHTDHVKSMSLDSDFESFTVLVSQPGEFLLTEQGPTL